MAKTLDKDLPLKLQFRRILFAEGYWSPIEVELSNYEDLGNTLKRRSLTDLDVLGIKFDRLFNRTCVVGDCKSGRNVSDANRLFWLRGVKDYFGADLAYYLRPNVDSHIAAIAPKMGLCALPASHLDGLELRLRAKETSAVLGDLTDFETTLQRWGIGVTKGVSPSQEQLQKKRVYSFLSYTYWYIERFRALMQLVGTFESVAHVLSPEDDRDVLLAFVGAERFAHCLLEAAAFVHSHGLQNIPKHARLYFYGGPFGLREKERTFDLIRKLGVVNEDLDPPWLRDTIELLGRMLHNPSGACDVLRYISVAYVSCVLHKKQEVMILNTNGSPVEAVVLAKDIILQFAKATGIRESIFDSIRSM